MQQNTNGIYRFPKDSNVQFLPLFFFLPEELVSRCATLIRLPRNVRIILNNEKFLDIVQSIQFLDDLINATSILTFPHFGFRGWKEDYSGFHPAWIYANAIPYWNDIIANKLGFNFDVLFRISSKMPIPYMTMDFCTRFMKVMVKEVVERENLQPVFDVVREMPCEEDFEVRNSNIRKDFIRKWYHTRSKRVKMVSIQTSDDTIRNEVYEIEDIKARFEDSVEAFDFCERFMAILSDKDQVILKLRMEAFTFQDIARELGYKNHSGVLKRMSSIKQKFIEWNSKYDL